MSQIIPGLVSTIIPVYNRASMIDQAVESVLGQTYRPIEIILVDDGSTDGETPGLLDRLAQDQPDIIRVIHRENGGAGLARESGRQVARGEFIQYLDSDDWLLPDKFKVQVAALLQNSDCDIAYGISRFVDADGNTIAEPSKRTGEQIDRLFPDLLVDRFWHTHTPLYRRSLSDAAGPWLKQRPEDWDLEGRMGALNAKLIHCPQVLSVQRSHQIGERYHKSNPLAYWLDEAWFLPRLYEYAVKAGVQARQSEMQHLADWMFMRARYLAAEGASVQANDLLELAGSFSNKAWRIKAFRAFSKLTGFRFAGKASALISRLL